MSIVQQRSTTSTRATAPSEIDFFAPVTVTILHVNFEQPIIAEFTGGGNRYKSKKRSAPIPQLLPRSGLPRHAPTARCGPTAVAMPTVFAMTEPRCAHTTGHLHDFGWIELAKSNKWWELYNPIRCWKHFDAPRWHGIEKRPMLLYNCTIPTTSTALWYKSQLQKLTMVKQTEMPRSIMFIVFSTAKHI